MTFAAPEFVVRNYVHVQHVQVKLEDATRAASACKKLLNQCLAGQLRSAQWQVPRFWFQIFIVWFIRDLSDSMKAGRWSHRD